MQTVQRIINYMKKNNINKFGFQLSFKGGYTIQFIKNNYVFKPYENPFNSIEKETLINLLKALKINDEFSLFQQYQTLLIKSIELKDIKKELNTPYYMELLKIYYDSKPFKYCSSFDPNIYDNILNDLSNKYNTIPDIEKELKQMINNSFKDIANQYNLRELIHLERI